MVSRATAVPLTLTLGADLRYFDYEEFGASDQSLNHETGLIPGLRIAAGVPSFGIDHTLEFGVWGGEVEYDGRTQSGQPHHTVTDDVIYRLLYRFDWRPRDPKGSLYAKIYWQNWDRDIQPANSVSGLFERYQWWTFEAGLRAVPWQQQNRSLAFELGVLQTNHGVIMIDLSDQGFGTPTLNLADGLGATAAVEYAIELASHNQLHFYLSCTTWKFGRSNSKAVTNGTSTIIITEPDSVSNQITLSIGYVFGF